MGMFSDKNTDLRTITVSDMCKLAKIALQLGPNIEGTSNYGKGKVLIGNMLSRLCS